MSRNYRLRLFFLNLFLIMFMIIIFLNIDIDFFYEEISNIDLLIGITSIFIVLWGDKNSIFKNLFLRLYVLISIALYIISFFLFHLFTISFFEPLYKLSLIVLLCLISFTTVYKFYRFEISTDVILLRRKVTRELRKVEKNFQLDKFEYLITAITKWAQENLHTKKNVDEIKTVVNLYQNINNLIVQNHYIFVDIGIEIDVDTFFKILETSYIEFYKVSIKSDLDKYPSNLIMKMIEHYYLKNNRKFLIKYLEIMDKFIEIDFSIGSKFAKGLRNSRNSLNFYETIYNNYTKNNESVNDLIVSSINKSMMCCQELGHILLNYF